LTGSSLVTLETGKERERTISKELEAYAPQGRSEGHLLHRPALGALLRLVTSVVKGRGAAPLRTGQPLVERAAADAETTGYFTDFHPFPDSFDP
jgi:hypothetical protein